MKENWQKDIHDRLGNYEKDAPNGLWESICSKMADADGDKVGGDSSAAHRWRRPACAAAAAGAALLLGYSIYNEYATGRQEMDLVAMSPGGNARVKPTGGHAPVNGADNVFAADNPLPRRNAYPVCRQSNIDILSAQAEDGMPFESVSFSNTETKTDTIENNDEQMCRISDRQKDYASRHTDGYAKLVAVNAPASRSVASHALSRWTVGTVAMGAMGSSKSYASMGSVVAAAGADNSYWTDSPMLGISLFNSGREVKTEYKHHFPVTVGIKVAYAINTRMSVESGLTYTRISSDMREGTAEHYFTGEQKLNYMGIPVSFKYNAASYKRLNLYGAVGVMAEKCVSGTTYKEYFINNTSRKSETLGIDSKPLQMSVNAAVGVQFNVLGGIGIYAEPGVNYHFDDGSSLQTIYKEKPLNFSFSVGVRYTIGEKQ